MAALGISCHMHSMWSNLNRILELICFRIIKTGTKVWARFVDPLKLAMDQAQTYKDWRVPRSLFESEVIKKRDDQDWLRDHKSRHYHADLIQLRIDELEKFKQEPGKVPSKATELLRSALFRNLGDICDDELYNVSLLYTKVEIEEYIDALCWLIEWIFLCPVPLTQNTAATNTSEQSIELVGPDNRQEIRDEPAAGFSIAKYAGKIHYAKSKYDLFLGYIQTYGRSALILKESRMSGLCHFGVAKALFEADMLPSIICGVDVMSLVIAGLICILPDEQLAVMFRNPDLVFSHSTRSIIKEEEQEEEVQDESIFEVSKLFFQLMFKNASLNEEMLEQILDQHFGMLTIKEAYLRTGREFNALISRINTPHHFLLLNRFSFSDIVISSIIRSVRDNIEHNMPLNLLVKTSTSESGTFTPSIHPDEKDSFNEICADDLPWEMSTDGKSKIIKTRLAEMYHVNNYITSQVQHFMSPKLQVTGSGIPGLLSRICNKTLLMGLGIARSIGVHLNGLSALLQFEDPESELSPSKEDLHLVISCVVQYTDLMEVAYGCPLFFHGPHTAQVPRALYQLRRKSAILDRNAWNTIIKRGEQAVWAEMVKIGVRMRVEKLLEAALKRLSASPNVMGRSLAHLTRNRSEPSTKKQLRVERTRSMF